MFLSGKRSKSGREDGGGREGGKEGWREEGRDLREWVRMEGEGG